MVFQWGLHPLGRPGWAAGFVFVAGAAIRLARFNIQTGTADKRYFVGLPSPAAAAIPASTIFFYPGGFNTAPVAWAAMALVIVPGLLMVSNIRFYSFKTLDLQSRRAYPVLALVALGLAVVVAHEIMLVAIAYTYLASGLVMWAWQRARRRGPEENEDELTTKATQTN
jgi:CDP-diacylglycerol--serine O-phosphatidyltransferase